MNYESGVMAEKGEPITVGLDEEHVEFENSERRGRRRIYIIAGLLVLGLAIIVFFLTRGDGAATPAGDENAQAPTVTVVTPGRTTVEGELTATGTLAARREMPVGVVGEGGRVVSVPVDAGDWVRQGQVLAQIDQSVQSQQVRSAAAQKWNVSVAECRTPISRKPISIARCSWSNAASSRRPMSTA